MTSKATDIQTPTSEGQIVLYQPDESISLEVKVDNHFETVWLTQQQIAQLFGVQKAAISKHMKNIFNSEELQKERVVSKMETTAKDGKTYKVDYYNLDMILSIGYRVNSCNATKFRQWASTILKEYLLHGYAIQPTLKQVEYHLSQQISAQGDKLAKVQQQVEQHEQQLNFFVRTNQPPHEGCIFQGHLLEGRDIVEQILRTAKQEVILIDAYVGADTFHILESRPAHVLATIYTERVGHNIQTLQNDHDAEYGTSRHIEVKPYRTSFHDRFLIVDDTVYHFGASLKDLGRRLFAFDIINLPKPLIMSQVQ